MKKLRIILVLFFFFAITCLLDSNVFALTSNDLISVGTGRYAITVTKQTTVDQIKGVLGEPKVETPSAFGGRAYTFYTDNNYSNYLYIETTSDGTIASYGSVDPTYKTYTYSYDDAYNYRENGVLHGCLFNFNGKIKGGIYYNKYDIFDGNYNNTVNFYEETYKSDENTYLRSLIEHSVPMFNALSTNQGYKTNLVFNEDFFYINQQFKELGSSIKDYFERMDKSNYYRGIKLREKIGFTNSVYYILNPGIIASLCSYSFGTDFSEKNIAVFDYNMDTKIITTGAVSPDAFKRHDSVDLTDDEVQKLVDGRKEYKKAIEDLYLENSIYKIEPQTKNPSTLVAGELVDSKKRGILEYVNAIRVAAGLSKLELDEHAYDISQHIATLISYRKTELGLDITHIPAKPDGVTQEYYQASLGVNDGYAENLGYASNETSTSIMMHHINMFLDDSAERPQNFSHRTKLLDTEFTRFGYGISNVTFANEFSGYKASDVKLQAWPAEGITFLESLVDKRFKWTAQFVKQYKVQDNTTVSVRCLNTDREWNFTEEEGTTSSNRYFTRYTKSISSINNKVVFYDSTIVPEVGYVYEITIHNLLDENTNRSTDYKYRAVFQYADEDSNPTGVTKISLTNLEKNGIKEVNGKPGTYYVPIGETVNFDIDLGNVVDNKVTWHSSSDKVKVTQNGLVTASDLCDEDVTISVYYDGSDVITSFLVRPYYALEQVGISNPDNDPFTSIDKGSTKRLHIDYIPLETTEPTSIEWKVISCTNESKEYDIDDSEIKKYIEVKVLDEKINPNDIKGRLISIKANDAELNNNKYKVRAHVKGLKDEFIGTYSFEVYVPLSTMRIEKAFDCLSNSYNGNTLNVEINYNDYIRTYPDGVLNFNMNYSPANTTVDRTVSWASSNNNVVSKYTGVNNFKINGEGSATLKATNSGNKDGSKVTAEVNVKIVAPITDLIVPTVKNIRLNKSGNNFNATDKVSVTKVPDINKSAVTYSSRNESIATVGKDGTVSFKKAGTVLIDVNCENVTRTIQYNVVYPVTELKFTSLKPYEERNNTLILDIDEQYQLNTIMSPSDTSVSQGYIRYSSDNNNIASVTNISGKITPKSIGSTIIRANVDSTHNLGITASTLINLKVVRKVKDIDVDSSVDMDINSTKTLSYRKSPSNATERVDVIWETESPELLTIDRNSGRITPIKSGVATVKLTANISVDGIQRDTITKNITVYVYKDGQLDFMKGDLDKNRVVNSNDAAIASDIYNRGYATSEELAIGDMNNDGNINSTDAALILDIYNK